MPLCLAVAPKPLRWVGGFPLLFNFCARPSAFPSVRLLPVLPPSPSPPRCSAIPPPVVIQVSYYLFYLFIVRGLAVLGSTSPTSRPKKRIEIESSGSQLPGRSSFFLRARGAEKSGAPFQLCERRSIPGLPHPAPEVAMCCEKLEWNGVPFILNRVIFHR